MNHVVQRVRRALFAALFAISGLAHADFEGRVVTVLDGDTVDVLVNQRPVRVRLAEIDAPERHQPWGTRARQKLSDLIFGKTVHVKELGQDWRGKRTVGTVYVDGLDVNRAMVEAGMAWAYRDYLRGRTMLDVESAARSADHGLWAGPEPTAPWKWRAEHRTRFGNDQTTGQLRHQP